MRAAFPSSRLFPAAGAIALVAFSAFICVRVGLRGFYDDADICFYGGWQVANGELPFLGSYASYAQLQFLIQGLFFKLFGVSWGSYVAHAALFNAAYVALLLVYTRRLGFGWGMAFVYAFAGALTYYTPVGHPHPDKHSFLFLLAALVIQQKLGRTSTFRGVAWGYGVITALLVLAGLSKLNPAVAFPLAVLPGLLGLPRRLWPAAAVGVAASAGAVLVVVGGIALAHGGFWQDFVYYLYTLPSEVGRSRASRGPLKLLKLGTQTHFYSLNLLFALAAALLVMVGRDRSGAGRLAQVRAHWRGPATAIALLLITYLHLWTIDQPQAVHITLLVPALALFHATILAVAGGRNPDGRDMAATLISVTVAAFLLIDLSEYHRLVTTTRLAYGREFQLGSMQARGASGIPELRQVEFIGVADDPDYLERFREVRDVLSAIPGNVYLSRLSPWFYAFQHKAPVLPVAYVNPGHSSPRVGSPEEGRLVDRLLANLSRADVRHLVMRNDVAPILLKQLAPMNLLCGTEQRRYVTDAVLCRPLTAGDTAAGRILLYSAAGVPAPPAQSAGSLQARPDLR